jgi:hypothetical protein
VPFFVTKSALFVQANVAINAKLTKLVWNFGMVRKMFLPLSLQPPPPQHFREKCFRCSFQYPKVPLEAGAPQIF